ncbi:MAG: hypothetical protein ACI90E_001259, partial [Yoonia sp.]
MQQLGRFAPPSPKSSNGLSRRRKAALIIQML